MPNIIFFVLGMHRSGTSVLTQTLQRAGCYLGTDLMPAHSIDNADGYFENTKIVEINERILAKWDQHWLSFSPPTRGQLNLDNFIEIESDFIEFFQKNLANHPIVAVKDPRLCLTYPVITEFLLKSGAPHPRAIVALRNPNEIAISINKRKHTGDTFIGEEEVDHLIIKLSWLKHMISIEKNSNIQENFYMEFSEPFSSPKEYAARFNSWANCDLNFNEEILHSYKPGLRRNKDISAQQDEFTELYSKLIQRTSTAPAQYVNLEKEMAQLYDHIVVKYHDRILTALESKLYNIDKRYISISRHNSELAQCEADLLERQATLARKEIEFNSYVEATQSEINDLRKEIEKIKSTSGWRLYRLETNIKRALKKIKHA